MVFPLVHYEYDSMGRLYKVRTGAGTSSSKVMQEMSYTPQGWLSCNDYMRGTSAIYGERLSYANSYAGFVTQREDAPGETTHYTYDYAGRLIREKVGKASYTDYLYDTRSNLLSISQGGIVTEEYAYSGDRLSSLDLGAGAHSFEYDSRGRIISDYTPNGGHGIKYNNYLNKVSGTEFINYSYLANGFKTSSLIHGIEDTRGLIYRGPFIFRQKPDRTWGMESVEVAEGKLTDGVALIYLKDHLGSVTKVVNANTGEVVESSDYTSYGKRASSTSSEYGDKFTGVTLRAHFTGKEDQKADFNVDYTDFGARLYSPVLRRWLTPDPLSEKYYGISPYAYCAGNPVNYIDPDGKAFDWILDAPFIIFDGTAAIYHKIKGNDDKAKEYLKNLGVDIAYAIAPGMTVATSRIKDVDKLFKFVQKATHGNSKLSTNAQHAYDIIELSTGRRVKTGISGGGIRIRDGKSKRAEKQVRSLNKKAGYEKYGSEIVHFEPAGEGARERIIEFEKARANMLRKKGELDKDIHIRP